MAITTNLMKLHRLLILVLTFALVSILLFLPLKLSQVKKENERLRHALELFTRNEGSCAVMDNGPRVMCVMRDGQVSRRDLEYSEQIVFRRPKERK